MVDDGLGGVLGITAVLRLPLGLNLEFASLRLNGRITSVWYEYYRMK